MGLDLSSNHKNSENYLNGYVSPLNKSMKMSPQWHHKEDVNSESDDSLLKQVKFDLPDNQNTQAIKRFKIDENEEAAFSINKDDNDVTNENEVT